MKSGPSWWRVVLLGSLIVLVALYFLFSRGAETASELKQTIRLESISRARMALVYPEVLADSQSGFFEFQTLLVGRDTFLVRYASGSPDALYFRSSCNDLSALTEEDARLNDDYFIRSTNSLLGNGIFFEHSEGATNNEVCAVRVDEKPTGTGTFNGRRVEIGHQEVPYLKMRFRHEKSITVSIIQGDFNNIIVISWTQS